MLIVMNMKSRMEVGEAVQQIAFVFLLLTKEVEEKSSLHCFEPLTAIQPSDLYMLMYAFYLRAGGMLKKCVMWLRYLN